MFVVYVGLLASVCVCELHIHVICVCMCVCMRACLCAHACDEWCVCMCVYLSTCREVGGIPGTCICVCVCMYASIPLYMHMCVHACVFICICVWVCKHRQTRTFRHSTIRPRTTVQTRPRFVDTCKRLQIAYSIQIENQASTVRPRKNNPETMECSELASCMVYDHYHIYIMEYD